MVGLRNIQADEGLKDWSYKVLSEKYVHITTGDGIYSKGMIISSGNTHKVMYKGFETFNGKDAVAVPEKDRAMFALKQLNQIKSFAPESITTCLAKEDKTVEIKALSATDNKAKYILLANAADKVQSTVANKIEWYKKLWSFIVSLVTCCTVEVSDEYAKIKNLAKQIIADCQIEYNKIVDEEQKAAAKAKEVEQKAIAEAKKIEKEVKQEVKNVVKA